MTTQTTQATRATRERRERAPDAYDPHFRAVRPAISLSTPCKGTRHVEALYDPHFPPLRQPGLTTR